MFAGKPILGIVGGIGSGKTFVADLFAEFGCFVIHSDELVKRAYNDPAVRLKLAAWFGPKVYSPDGQVDRKALAAIIFSDSQARHRLEELVHPLVDQHRRQLMTDAAANPNGPAAFVWDTPLLLETGLDRQCDAIVFVQAPLEMRLTRVRQSRGWDAPELNQREKLQLPLDRKREISEYVVENTADADYARVQVQEVLTRIKGLSA